jgi:hypothetical protein
MYFESCLFIRSLGISCLSSLASASTILFGSPDQGSEYLVWPSLAGSVHSRLAVAWTYTGEDSVPPWTTRRLESRRTAVCRGALHQGRSLREPSIDS